MHIHRLTPAGLVPALVVLSACTDARHVSSPEGIPPVQSSQIAVGDRFDIADLPAATSFRELAFVCKRGSSASFTASADITVPGLVTSFSLQDDECILIADKGGATATITVTETSAQAGFVFDQVELTQLTCALGNAHCGGAPSVTTTTQGNPATGLIGGGAGTSGLSGFSAIFMNVQVAGGEGCTPGYWKQSQHFDSWEGHDPTDLFGSVFNLPSSLARPDQNVNPATLTLLGALELRGGGVNALIRHAVAALLNAASSGVDYDLTEAEVISAFNAALAAGGGAIETQKDDFATFNEQGCPLN